MVKFLKNAGFPQAKCFLNSGSLWKMQVREWAFADVDLDLGKAPGWEEQDRVDVTSNNPTVVPPASDPDGVTTIWRWGTAQMTANFYAKTPGFTYIYPFKGNPSVALEDARIQVEVVTRSAAKREEISMTKLLGKTVALNATDAVTYEMETTKTLPSSESSPESIAALLPGDVNHLVIASHGGYLGTAGSTSELCMFAWGVRSSIRLSIHNVDAVFSAVKNKMAEDAVIWLGGCNIGENNEFCQKAATQSGCTVVAATKALAAMKVAKGNIDMADRYAAPKVFIANGKSPVVMSGFCAKQKKYKFAVPV